MFSSTFFGLTVLLTSAFCAQLRPQIPSIASTTLSSSPHVFEVTPEVIVTVVGHGSDTSAILPYAKILREDLLTVTSFACLQPVAVVTEPPLDSILRILLTLDPSLKFVLFNGDPTDEGYTMDIARKTVTITGTAPVGVWWGTRTLLQQVVLALKDNSKGIDLPLGKIHDSPGWEVRGFMLDAGRHWFDIGFLSELCIYASFFKLNELHLHASDNLWNPAFLYGEGNEGWKKLYAAFRFRPPKGSSLQGLVSRFNESWSKEEFLSLQNTCNQHGITIIPEIDTPGHSLVINQWKPQLMEVGQPDHLNLSHPETIPTIKSIWEELLPWFASREVSIGADEYDASLANDYIAFVNSMSDFIHAKSGKSIRVWGTNEPSKTLSVSQNVTIQHWNFPGDDIPVRLMKQGYDIINSEQHFLYLDEKTSEGDQFPQELNQDLIWSGAPGGMGWAPNIFSPTDPTNNTGIDNKHLRGSIMALWCDWGNNATTKLEIYYQLARSLAVFAEKTWAGSGVRESALTRDEFNAVYPVLNAAAPGQNLNRVAPSMNGIVYQYGDPILPFTTHIDSVGPPYTLTFSVMPSSRHPDKGELFSGTDSVLHVSNLTFEATGQLYPLGVSLPPDQFTTVAVHGTREFTYVVLNGDEDHRLYWTTNMDIWGDYMQLGNMSFAAPAKTIGAGFSGIIRNVSLRVQ
ncbi:glycoside hydrolase [Panus rudis PR-1116 ss-1]|nr:glycoside hydrolase [Panus rudis PR-1116 ss-1]